MLGVVLLLFQLLLYPLSGSRCSCFSYSIAWLPLRLAKVSLSCKQTKKSSLPSPWERECVCVQVYTIKTLSTLGILCIGETLLYIYNYVLSNPSFSPVAAHHCLAFAVPCPSGVFPFLTPVVKSTSPPPVAARHCLVSTLPRACSSW